jgi:hypothetical protein
VEFKIDEHQRQRVGGVCFSWGQRVAEFFLKLPTR